MSMQQPTFLVLTVLADGPHHGYAIMRAVEEVSGGTVVIRPGTLYAALDRLAVEGLIEVAREEESAGGRTRRCYQLTPAGTTALRSEAEQRRRQADLAISRLTRPTPAPAGPALNPA